ncbi:E3 ubiquitin-protein ligase MARCHF5 [Tursiops truncatus]|uniref:E3 ubiquitin-protein ligase MARCHF5 n=1 Tax=Tursiops truncatus TaxID=9739 RepID=UPI003CCF6672
MLLTVERHIPLLPGKRPAGHFSLWRKETGGRRPGGGGRDGGGRGGLCSLLRGRSEDYISQLLRRQQLGARGPWTGTLGRRAGTRAAIAASPPQAPPPRSPPPPPDARGPRTATAGLAEPPREAGWGFAAAAGLRPTPPPLSAIVPGPGPDRAHWGGECAASDENAGPSPTADAGQVVGHKEGLDVMERADPLFLLIGLPTIPVMLILGKMIRWEDYVLRLWRKYSNKLQILNSIFPGIGCPVPRIPAEANPLADHVSATRILCGALVFPTIATIVGKLMFSSVNSNLQRTILGGIAFVAIKGAFKVYFKQQQYLRQAHRKILNYPEQEEA